MTARNISKQNPSSISGQFEQIEKTSSTLKRHPKMELSKPDLLQLLGVLEGELQAREIVIAVLKAEQVKQLLYPKRKSASTADPWAALQRDCLGAFDATFDEALVKNLYGMQLSQLESFLKQYTVAQSKLKQQLIDTEQRCEKLLSELDDEKHKHAQDTAQGDDVTYLLEKERERLHQENEFERQQNRCLEKDIKCLTDTLEQERVRQKQMILLLLGERKRLIFRFAEEKQKSDRLSQILCDEKGKIADMVDGLEEESKKSLQMEAELERQLCEFEIERDQFKIEMNELESKNQELSLLVQKLQEEIETLKQSSQAKLGEGVRSTIVTMVSNPTIRAVPTISPSVSPPRGVARAVSLKSGPAPATPAKPPGLIPQTSVKKPLSVSPVSQQKLAFKMPVPETATALVTTVSQCTDSAILSPETDKAMNDANAKMQPANSQKSVNARKMSVGRGAPPPIPPNKPVLTPHVLHRKDTATKPPVPPRSDITPDSSSDKRVGVQSRLSSKSSDDSTGKEESQVGLKNREMRNVESEVLVEELSDFQQMLISMVSN